MSENGEDYVTYDLFALELLYLQEALGKCLEQETLLARSFYKCLFDEHPATRKLFSQDRHKQIVMFNTLIESAAAEIRNPSSLEPLLRAVGVHHRRMDLTKRHLEMGRNAFFSAVKACIGDDDFNSHQHIWNNLYTMLIDVMMSE